MAKPPSKGIARLHNRRRALPQNREVEAKIQISLLLAIQLLNSPNDNPLTQFLIANNLLSPGFHYRIGTQHTFYADTADSLAQKMNMTLRRRMHGEDGYVVEGFKSLVETTDIQDRYEREQGRPDIYQHARSYVNEHGEKALLHIWDETMKILFPSPANPKSTRPMQIKSKIYNTFSAGGKAQHVQQAWDLLHMFDVTLPEQNRPKEFSNEYLKLFDNNRLSVKKALTRVLMGILPFQSNKLEYYASGLTARQRKNIRGKAPELQFVGKDQVVRCFYHLLYNGYEYESASDCGQSEAFKKPPRKLSQMLKISEIELEAKLRQNQSLPNPADLGYLKDTVGGFLANLDIALGERKFGDTGIYPSHSKGIINLCARGGASLKAEDIQNLILTPAQANQVMQLSRQYGL